MKPWVHLQIERRHQYKHGNVSHCLFLLHCRNKKFQEIPFTFNISTSDLHDFNVSKKLTNISDSHQVLISGRLPQLYLGSFLFLQDSLCSTWHTIDAVDKKYQLLIPWMARVDLIAWVDVLERFQGWMPRWMMQDVSLVHQSSPKENQKLSS